MVRAAFLFCLSAILAIFIGCVGSASRNRAAGPEASTAGDDQGPVSLRPLSTPYPDPASNAAGMAAGPEDGMGYAPAADGSAPARFSPHSPYAALFTAYGNGTTAYVPPVRVNPPTIVGPLPPNPEASGVTYVHNVPTIVDSSYVPPPYAIASYPDAGVAAASSATVYTASGGGQAPVIYVTPPAPAAIDPVSGGGYATQAQYLEAQGISLQPYILPAAPAAAVIPATPAYTPSHVPSAAPTPATAIAAGQLRLIPAPDIPPSNRPNDAAPSQWFEILRPGDGPLRIGRVSASCVCVSPRVPNRHVAAGERALIEARIVSKPARDNLTYVLFANVLEPANAVLDADVTIKLP